jgi:hypothetical protein
VERCNTRTVSLAPTRNRRGAAPHRQARRVTSPEPNAWTLKRRDESCTLVQTCWTPDDRVYRGVVLLMFPAEPPALAPPITPTASRSSSRQDQSKVAPSAAVPTPPPVPESPTDLSTSVMMVRPHSQSHAVTERRERKDQRMIKRCEVSRSWRRAQRWSHDRCGKCIKARDLLPGSSIRPTMCPTPVLPALFRRR